MLNHILPVLVNSQVAIVFRKHKQMLPIQMYKNPPEQAEY